MVALAEGAAILLGMAPGRSSLVAVAFSSWPDPSNPRGQAVPIGTARASYDDPGPGVTIEVSIGAPPPGAR